MILPYVIDNHTHKLADVLSRLLAQYTRRSFDVATAYFTVSGFGLLRAGIEQTGSFRLLLGAEPESGHDLGMIPRESAIRGLLRRDLEQLPFNEATLRTVEALVAVLRREGVAVRLYALGFLHAKCYLFYADEPDGTASFERFKPVAGIVGSSNFTYPGLVTNRELNLAHKVVLGPEEIHDEDAARAVSWLTESDSTGWGTGEQARFTELVPDSHQLVKSEVGARAILDLERWYQEHWNQSRDFKQELIDILNASKYGEKEYTPFEVYQKALWEYFREGLGEEDKPQTRSAVELAEFQEDAVKKARNILKRYDGVMIADSVGLGKTWIGKKLLEDFAYHMRQKALVVCPAALKQMWEGALSEATIAAQVLSQEELGRQTFDAGRYQDADVVLIDESHNFRNPSAGRYANMELVIGGNSGRGRDGQRKKVILLTATPINNDIFDLYHQINLVTRNDRTYFSSAGIGNLHSFFRRARQETRAHEASIRLFNLLEEFVIRRTRPFIKQAYPDATIRGERIRFPERKLKTVRYDLEATYAGIYDDVVGGIDKLKLAPYSLEEYKKRDSDKDQMEIGREEALVGIFKSRYLKRFESSIDSFRISVRRALAFLRTFETYLDGGRLMRSSDFHKAIRYLEREDEEDDATPASLADEIDENDDARAALEAMENIDPSRYRMTDLRAAVQKDVDTLTELWNKVKDIRPEHDAKLLRLKSLLSNELRGQKVLVFTYYRDTARYLWHELGDPKCPRAESFKSELGGAHIRRMDGGSDAKERVRIVEAFAPVANNRAELLGTDKEINVLLSTDVLSEGQNLQDCGVVLNYDLHWNPTRMVQRAGRIDRIGSKFDTLWLYNMFPDAGLENLLGLVQRLSARIDAIDRSGFLDASVLGELVHPRNFNTLRKIAEEDGSVIQEEEEFTELASSEFLERQLRAFLDSQGQEALDALPDGIHSGLVQAGARGVFFYFQAQPKRGEKMHFWRYFDLRDGRIIDNRYLIANLISCERDTARAVEPSMFQQVFDLQEKVIADILASTEQQQALEAAPKILDTIQKTVTTIFESYLNSPEISRKETVAAIRFLEQPMLVSQLKTLRKRHAEFQKTGEIHALLAQVRGLEAEVSGASDIDDARVAGANVLKREDLRLICFDFLSGG